MKAKVIFDACFRGVNQLRHVPPLVPPPLVPPPLVPPPLVSPPSVSFTFAEFLSCLSSPFRMYNHPFCLACTLNRNMQVRIKCQAAYQHAI